MIAELAPERQFRGPGCTDACRVLRVFQAGVFGRQELLSHDPESHERYGRRLAGDAGAFDILETGLLTLHRNHLTVWVDGKRVPLSALELRIVVVLADHFDQVVSYPALMRTVWSASVPASERADRHLLRITVGRLRKRLGPRAGGLIVTVKEVGLRLMAWPTGRDAPAVWPSATGGRWSRAHDVCVMCGTTRNPHSARGFCTTCWEAAKIVAGGAS